MSNAFIGAAVTPGSSTIGNYGLIVTERQNQWQPGTIGVAGFAGVGGSRMSGRFAGTAAVTVVTTGAGASCTGLTVIHGSQNRHPDSGTVTTLALIGAGRMGGTFTGDAAQTIVTTAAGTGLPGHQRVVKSHTQPAGGVMTHVAGQSSGYVIGAFPCGNDVIVAVGTGVCGLTVIDGD